MNPRQIRPRSRSATAATVALAVALPASWLGLAAPPAAAAPPPAAYSADAHGDIVDLDVDLLTLDLAGVQVGHSRSTVASTPTDGTSTATSANLGGSLAGTGLVLNEERVTAPPSQDPPARTMLGVPLAPVVTVGTIQGDVQAAWDGATTCVPAAQDGTRVLSDSRTTLAGLTLASVPGLGTLADVTASETRTRTHLDDGGAGGSDVVSRTTATVGDISLLGGAVTVDVTNPVVLEARSDGTTGSAGYVNPPTVTVGVGDETIELLPGDNETVELPVALDLLVDLSISVYPVQDRSAGATGGAAVDALLGIDLTVLDTALLDAADVNLDIAPMSVEATAPEGGVECGASDDDAPAAPVIEAPTDGDVTNDATPEFSGTAEPGSTVIVQDADGNEVCSDVAAPLTGAWSCTPGQPLPDGEDTYTAIATDGADNASAPDTVTFVVDTDTSVGVLTPADGSSTADTTPAVTGTGEAGATIGVTENGLPICSTAVQQDGTWSCAPTLPLLPVEHTFTVTAEDEAGNTDTATTTFTIVLSDGDTTPPAAPVITSPAEGASVQDTTPPITGSGEPGATVTVTEGSTVLCTAVVEGDRSWSCSPAVPLPLGPHTVSAAQTDADGDVGPADSVTFTIAAPAPTTPGPGDTDGDGLSDGQEGTIGTHPDNPDTDGDGLADGAEVDVHGTDPLDRDTDGDRITDGREVTGVRIKERFEVCGRKARSAIIVRPDPLRKDTDRDGLSDGKEVRGYTIKQKVRTKKTTFVIGRTRSNPTKKDTDRDGLKDKVEKTGKANKRFGRDRTDPTTCDTDRGGVRDGAEVRAKSNPADWRSGPRDPRVRESRAATFGIG